MWGAANTKRVSVWQDEERITAQTLTARQRERTNEEEHQRMVRTRDSIKQWLVLAPIALATGQSGAAGIDIEQIKGKASSDPKPERRSPLPVKN